MYTESSFLQKPLLEKFLRLQQIPQRLYLLEEFLLEAKKNPEANIIPSLNEALTLAPQWVSVDFWGEFAKIIIKHKDLYPTLPHLFHFFYLHQHVLYNEEIEKRIWSAWLSSDLSSFLYSHIAKIHLLLSRQKIPLSSLWECYLDFKKKFPVEEKKLFNNLYSTQKEYSDEKKEAFTLITLLCEKSSPQEKEQQFLALLEKTRKIPFDFFETIFSCIYENVSPQAILQLYSYKAKNFKLTDNDLYNLASIAKELEDTDLYWRIITVIHNRAALPEHLVHKWLISGENRSGYGLVEIIDEDIFALLRQLDQPLYLIFYHYLHVFSELKEKLVNNSRHKRILAHKKNIFSDLTKQYSQIFSKLKTIKSTTSDLTKTYETGSNIFDKSKSNYERNVEYLSHILGFSLFAFDLKKIQDLIAELAAAKKSDHFKKLSHQLSLYEEKDLVHKSKVLALQLSLLFCPENYRALQAIKKEDAQLLHELESFILSETYSRFRRRHKLKNHGVIGFQ